MILSLTSVLLPQFQDKVSAYGQPAFFGEVAFMLWLVIKGARPPAPEAVALSPAPAWRKRCRNGLRLTTFRMNTCKSVSKQSTLTVIMHLTRTLESKMVQR